MTLEHRSTRTGAASHRPGYIDPHALRELWFHTGTGCNLACPFCLEGSKPGDLRLGAMTLRDVQPLIDEAHGLGVERISFTGGEPFTVRDFVKILAYAADRAPCLVLTNATSPVARRLHEIETLHACGFPVRFRVSIDYPDRRRHDAGRGDGTFDLAWAGMAALHERGFAVSLAHQVDPAADPDTVRHAFEALLVEHGLPADTTQVGFPDFLAPGSRPTVPVVTESCMTAHQTETSRKEFMCAFSKMVVKKDGRMRVYACTLVDDDESYDLGGSLAEAMGQRVFLRHHRCYSCFALGSSCSELGATGRR